MYWFSDWLLFNALRSSKIHDENKSKNSYSIRLKDTTGMSIESKVRCWPPTTISKMFFSLGAMFLLREMSWHAPCTWHSITSSAYFIRPTYLMGFILRWKSRVLFNLIKIDVCWIYINIKTCQILSH